MFKFYRLSDLQDSMEAICNAKPKIYTQAELDEAVKAEREACAMKCMNLFAKYNIERSQINSNYITGKISGALECAEAIRVKGAKCLN